MRLAVILIAVTSAAAAFATPRVIMLDYQRVTGERIELGEVALLEEWPPEQLAKLDKLDLGRAPLPGHEQRINTAFVQQRVFATLGRSDGFEFVAEPIHHVIGDGECIAASRLRELAEALVWEETGWGANEAALRLLREPRDLWLPTGDYDLEARCLSSDYYGSTLVKIVAMQDGLETGSRTVAYSISRTKPVLVAAGTLNRGDVISADNVEIRRTEIAQEYHESKMLTDINEIVGKKMRRFVARGRALSIDDIDDPPAVRRGDAVSVWVKSGPVTVKTEGEAEEAGRIGDRIQVQTNGRTLWGQIIKDRVVIAEVD